MNSYAKMSIVVASALLTSACSSGGGGTETFEFPEPKRFDAKAATFDANSAIITNPFLSFTVGRKSVYSGETEDGLERIEIETLAETKIVDGIECAVVLDRVFIDDSLVEETWDWYAQDTDGNVWYMGESSNDYEDGKLISTAGSWEAGKDVVNLGKIAEAGIQMFADPVVGTIYYQEFYEGEAIDAAEIVDVAAPVTLSDGTQYVTIKTKEWNPYDPTGFEYKYYAENTGLVLETDEEGDEPIELISQQD